MNEQINHDEKSRVMRWARITLIVLTIFLAAEALGSFKSLGNPNPSFNSISVTGEGEVVSIPDIANFSFIVSVEAKTVSDAQARVTEKIDVILMELQDMGIEEKDIKTTNYSVRPKYIYTASACNLGYCPPSKQTLDGYTTTHNISVKVRDAEQVGQALAIVGDKGATNISNVDFITEDLDLLVEEARTQAIVDARVKAKRLAKDLGVRLVRVVSFYENSGPRPYLESYAIGGDMVRTASAPTLPTGENKTTVSVNVTYEIR